ncbi:Uncharacterized protein TPAR_05694 [Tolypocladium paradoxum]|uniref:DRBM domain-containing protein n=1 Tax=Tolypocladium paradoxum TaxID=94208 RepID=A0A2S4KV18_9HYPO|nr:Uncharacterized protein TPAR_05694 [Tolypocladium paradoxum]
MNLGMGAVVSLSPSALAKYGQRIAEVFVLEGGGESVARPASRRLFGEWLQEPRSQTKTESTSPRRHRHTNGIPTYRQSHRSSSLRKPSAMEPNDPSRKVRVPWDRLRAWIDAQEAVERERNSPAPLSQAQLEAISMLISFGNEPDVGDRDHVSALMQTIQGRHLMAPTFVDDEPISMPVDGHFKLMWRCVCSVEGFGSFPRERYGVEAGKQPPSFQSKKNAKRYAAKHALQCVRDSPHPGTLSSAPANKRTGAGLSPSPARPSPARRITRETSPQRASQTSESAAPDPQSGNGGPDGDEAASVFRQISALATRLGLESPCFRIEPDDGMPNFFSGRPVFQRGGRIPPDLGVVSGVLGKRQARMQMAEKVLEWLQEEERNREDIVNSLWTKGP